MDTKQVTFGYKHLEVGHPNNTKDYPVCGNRTTTDLAVGDYCQLRAGHGTGHLGVGRCKFHGGANGAGPEAGRYSTGRYSHVYTGRLAEYYRQVVESGDDPIDLIPELQAMQVMLTYQLDEFSRILAGQSLAAAGRDALSNLRATSGLPASIVGSDRTKRRRSRGGDDDSTNDLSFGRQTGVDGGVGKDGLLEDSAVIPHSKFSVSSAEVMIGEVVEGEDADYVAKVSAAKFQALLDTAGRISEMISKIVAMRNNTAMTKAEIMFLGGVIKDAMEEYVPREKWGAYLKYLRKRSGSIFGEEKVEDSK